jgi:hypothetical protein
VAGIEGFDAGRVGQADRRLEERPFLAFLAGDRAVVPRLGAVGLACRLGLARRLAAGRRLAGRPSVRVRAALRHRG